MNGCMGCMHSIAYVHRYSYATACTLPVPVPSLNKGGGRTVIIFAMPHYSQTATQTCIDIRYIISLQRLVGPTFIYFVTKLDKVTF